MQIDNTVLAKLEKLSHLRIEEDKKEEIIGQLTEIVSYVENLAELDTDHLDASFSTLEGGTPMREDIVDSNPSISESILKNSPQRDDGFFVVPAIIE